MQDVGLVPVIAVEDPARRLHNLTIARALELRRTASALRVVNQLLDMVKNKADQLRRGNWVLQCDVISDSFQIAKRRLRPDYISHLARHFLACECVATRHSANACSYRKRVVKGKTWAVSVGRGGRRAFKKKIKKKK